MGISQHVPTLPPFITFPLDLMGPEPGAGVGGGSDGGAHPGLQWVVYMPGNLCSDLQSLLLVEWDPFSWQGDQPT